MCAPSRPSPPPAPAPQPTPTPTPEKNLQDVLAELKASITITER